MIHADDDEFDPIFEAQMAATKACDAMMETLTEQMDALESGSMTEEQRLEAASKVEDLYETVKKRTEEVRPNNLYQCSFVSGP